MSEQKNQNLPKKPLNNYLKYSVLGFQMAAIIGLSVFGGKKLDELLGFQKTPYFTVALGLIAVVASLYMVIKDFLRK
ncbi:MAG: AtpZ/AtpI family protein [Bacteroidia bacterium]